MGGSERSAFSMSNGYRQKLPYPKKTFRHVPFEEEGDVLNTLKVTLASAFILLRNASTPHYATVQL